MFCYKWIIFTFQLVLKNSGLFRSVWCVREILKIDFCIFDKYLGLFHSTHCACISAATDVMSSYCSILCWHLSSVPLFIRWWIVFIVFVWSLDRVCSDSFCWWWYRRSVQSMYWQTCLQSIFVIKQLPWWLLFFVWNFNWFQTVVAVDGHASDNYVYADLVRVAISCVRSWAASSRKLD